MIKNSYLKVVATTSLRIEDDFSLYLIFISFLEENLHLKTYNFHRCKTSVNGGVGRHMRH